MINLDDSYAVKSISECIKLMSVDEVTPEVMDKLLAVDKDLWTAEIAEMRRYYKDDIAAKGGRIPAALEAQLDALEARLAK